MITDSQNFGNCWFIGAEFCNIALTIICQAISPSAASDKHRVRSIDLHRVLSFLCCSQAEMPCTAADKQSEAYPEVSDLVITSSYTSLAPAVSCTHWSPSDHFPVFTKLSINPAPLPPPTLHSFRWLHSIDIGSFLTDLKSSQLITDPPKSLGPLLSAYNTTLSSLLDKHAPIITKLSRRQSPSNPWFSTTLRAFRSTLRHAENIWKRTHSAADWSSFKSLRNQYQ